jgi:hypothetical protein
LRTPVRGVHKGRGRQPRGIDQERATMSAAKRSTGKSAARPAPKKTAKPAKTAKTAKKKAATPAPKKSAVKAAGAARASSASARASKKAKAPVAKKAAASPSRAFPRRADLGAPIDSFFEKQPPHLLPIVEELRAIVTNAVPDASSSIKWGMPFYVIGSETVCAIAGFKSHVNLILAGPPGTFDDPEGLLEGEGKTGRHLKLRSVEELPRDAVRGWLETAARLARTGGKG